MKHILTFLHKGVGFKLVALLLAVGVGVMLFQLSGAYKEHTLNVHTEIKANPPGIAKIIDRTGQPPSTDSDIVSSGENQLSETEPASQPETQTTPPGDNTQPQKWYIPPVIKKILGGDGEDEAPSPSSIDLKSNRPTVLTINTDIDFGTVFPGETLQGHFIVSLTGTSNTTDTDNWTTPFTSVTYNVTMKLYSGSGFEDMRPFLFVQRDPGESDNEPDNTANGTAGDYWALGDLNSDNDTSDKWFVTFNATDDIPLDDYWTEIWIEVP